MKRIAWLSAVALSAGLCTGAFAQVTGTVKLTGPAPKRQPVAGIAQVKDCAAKHKDPLLDESIVADASGNLANVVVSLQGPNVKGEAPKEPAVLDQKGCQYVPHVIDMTIGQDLLAKNDDEFLHNVHTLPENSEPSNTAQPNKDPKGLKLKPVKAAEVFKVKCDVHPWMSAWVAAFDHPYHTVTGEDGTYELATEGLKDGDYEIVFWQEKLGTSKGEKVTIKGGKATKDYAFKPKAAAADPKATGAPAAAREVALTSLTGKDDQACCEKCEPQAKAKPAVAAK